MPDEQKESAMQPRAWELWSALDEYGDRFFIEITRDEGAAAGWPHFVMPLFGRAPLALAPTPAKASDQWPNHERLAELLKQAEDDARQTDDPRCGDMVNSLRRFHANIVVAMNASAPVPESPSTEAPKEVSHTDDVCVQHSGSLPLRASSGSASTGAAHLTNAEVGRAPVPERKPVAFRERRQIGDDSEGEAQYRKNVKQWERTVEDVLDNVLGYHERTVLSYAEGGGKAATVTVREVRELAYAVRMLIQGREIDREINRRAHPSDSRETLERAAQVCEALGEERRAEAVEFSNRDNHELYALLVKEARTADECARRIRALPAVPSEDTERLASAVDDSDDPTEDYPNGQCTHGVGFDEDCEACEAEDREERERSTAHAARSTPASTPSEEHTT